MRPIFGKAEGLVWIENADERGFFEVCLRTSATSYLVDLRTNDQGVAESRSRDLGQAIALARTL